MMPPHFQRNFCGDFLKNMHFDPQIHPFWWRCGFPMVGKHEFSVGWQQAPHASQWRPNPFTESLRTAVWGLSQVPEAFSRMHLFLRKRVGSMWKCKKYQILLQNFAVAGWRSAACFPCYRLPLCGSIHWPKTLELYPILAKMDKKQTWEGIRLYSMRKTLPSG